MALKNLQLVDLQVFAMPRVTLKPLVPTIPCFASIVVSLLEKVCSRKSDAKFDSTCFSTDTLLS